jgi:hypothetical protein
VKVTRSKLAAMGGKENCDPMEPDDDDVKPSTKKKGKVKRSLFKKGGASGGESY